MFAFFYVTAVTICKVISGTKNYITNKISRNDAIKNNKTGYWDTNGAYKDPMTDDQIHYENLKNGDRVLMNLKGDVLRNIDEEQRLSTIVNKNISLVKESSPVVLLGRFEDVCPNKLNKGICKHVPNRAAVYTNREGVLYFRQPSCGTVSVQYIYVDIENGKYEILENATKKDLEWISKANKGWDEGTRSFITLNKLVDRI